MFIIAWGRFMFVPPDFVEFQRNCQDSELVSLAVNLEFDYLNTLLLAMAMKDEPTFFLLESANSDKTFSRYSFCGYYYRNIFRCVNDRLYCNDREVAAANPFVELFKLFQHRHQRPCPLFDGFQGGLVGYLSYDSVNYMDELRQPVKNIVDGCNFSFVEVDRFFVFDNYLQRCYAVAVTNAATPEKSYHSALQDLEHMALDLRQRLQNVIKQVGCLHELTRRQETIEQLEKKYQQSISRDLSSLQQRQCINALRQELAAGEAIQANLSVRFSFPAVDPFSFYRRLRRINPSPYMFYIRWHDEVLAGASPEIHLRVTGQTATIKPLAGTRPRDNRPLDVICNDLLADEKERAEHLMLIDLARNDLYTCCHPESVRVVRPYTPEVYSHVIHITSEVQGRLKEDIPTWKLFSKTFPAGTLTGAPKIRAIELLEQYEGSPRGFYGGCVGYFNYDGDINTAITIRSAFFTAEESIFRAGAGIVIDSNSDYESREVERKAAVVRQTLFRCHAHREER